jgi:hypothetical protein
MLVTSDQGTIKLSCNQVLVVEACNPSYLGDWDQEDHGLSPDWTKSYENSSQPIGGCGGVRLLSRQWLEA